MNRFFVTNPTYTLAIFNYLISQGYEEIEQTVINDDDNEPIKIVIDKETETFWQTDDKALESLENSITKHQNEIETVTLKEVTEWN
jgi:biopolymer transport protein ExbD